MHEKFVVEETVKLHMGAQMFNFKTNVCVSLSCYLSESQGMAICSVKGLTFMFCPETYFIPNTVNIRYEICVLINVQW